MTSIALGSCIASRVGSTEPAKYPSEEFELYSIPAHDAGGSTIVRGVDIGSAKQNVQPGDVLLSKIIPHIRRVRIVSDASGRRQLASGEWIIFRTKLYDQKYLRHYLLSDRFHAQFMNTVAGVGGSLVRARPEFVKKITAPLPSIGEQRRIAAILDQADAIRTKRRQALEHLALLPQALLHSTTGGAARNLPLGEVALIQGGLQVTSRRDALERRVPYLRVANAFRGHLDLSDVKSMGATDAEVHRTCLQHGDLLFVEGHGNAREVGRVSRWQDELPQCVHQNHLIRARVDPERLDSRFAEEWFNSPPLTRYFQRSCKTTSGLNTISAATVRKAPIDLPELSDQREFSRMVNNVDLQSQRMKRQLAADDELFASLQARAFRSDL